MAWSPLIGAALAMIASGVIIVARIVYPGPTLYIRHANPVFEGPLIASALIAWYGFRTAVAGRSLLRDELL